MEEDRQLHANESSCWAELLPSIAGEEGNPVLSLIQNYFYVVSKRADLDFMLKVAHDMLLALVQNGNFEMAQKMSQVELKLRDMIHNEQLQREQRQQQPPPQQQMNLNLNGGALTVGEMKADQVNDVHNNENVNINNDGGKGEFH